MYLNLLVASILLHSKSKVEFRKRANKIRAEVQTTFLSTFHVDVPNPVFLPLHGPPHGTTPESISSFFFNHTELFLSIPSTLKITTAHQRQSFMVKNKMLKKENHREE